MSFSVSIHGLDAIRTQFANAPQAVERAAMRSINAVAAKVRTQASKDIRQRYALTAQTVDKYLVLRKASPTKLEARIIGQKRGILLSPKNYGAKQLSKPVKHPKRSTGDARRGIPAGRKQGGVSYRVLRRGGNRFVEEYFMIPIRAGTADGGNGWAVVKRIAGGRAGGNRPWKQVFEVQYRVSTHQAFEHLRPGYVEKLPADLEVAFRKQLQHELRLPAA